MDRGIQTGRKALLRSPSLPEAYSCTGERCRWSAARGKGVHHGEPACTISRQRLTSGWSEPLGRSSPLTTTHDSLGSSCVSALSIEQMYSQVVSRYTPLWACVQEDVCGPIRREYGPAGLRCERWAGCEPDRLTCVRAGLLPLGEHRLWPRRAVLFRSSLCRRGKTRG